MQKWKAERRYGMRARIIREDIDLNHLIIGEASVWLTDREIKDLVHDVSQYVYDKRLFLD